jgi:hypothetical protein
VSVLHRPCYKLYLQLMMYHRPWWRWSCNSAYIKHRNSNYVCPTCRRYVHIHMCQLENIPCADVSHSVCFLGGPLVNKIGVKWALVIGSMSFPIEGSAYYCNSKFGNQWVRNRDFSQANSLT